MNDQIHKAETHIEPVSQEHEATLRKRRLMLKDAIAGAVAAS